MEAKWSSMEANRFKTEGFCIGFRPAFAIDRKKMGVDALLLSRMTCRPIRRVPGAPGFIASADAS